MGKHIWRILRISALVVIGSLLLFGYIGARIGRQILGDVDASLPDINWVQKHTLKRVTTVYSRDAKIVGTLSEERRKVVALDQVSPFVLRALIATEDSRFYEHHGVDFWGIGRAAWSNFRHGSTGQGASTITMQLVRHYFLTQDQSYWRKLQEALLARRLEKMLSKEEILIRYLNEVYFGSGAYGIQSASATYFGKSARDLSVPEAALLIGLLQSPTQLSPYHNPSGARERTMAVLMRMRNLGYITVEEQNEGVRRYQQLAPKKPLEASNIVKYPYFTNYALSVVAKQIPRNTLYEEGLAIRTTMDIRQQSIAEREVASILDSSGRDHGVDSAAVVLIDNQTGEVRAMVGGRKWSQKDSFNRAWQSRLQAGSSFKPILYATALISGFTPETVVSDDPVIIKYTNTDGSQVTWEPHNYDQTSKGAIPLREALKLSRNVVAARLVCRTGLEALIVMAHQLGITSKLPPVPSLALGTGEVSPLEMCVAYSTIARGGMYLPPICVRSITTPQGDTLPLINDGMGNALPPDAAANLTEMMMRVIEKGTGQAARLSGLQAAGKTGTTDSYRDAWFIGFTPTYTLAVWMGNNDHRPSYGMTGGSLPATLWQRIMSQVEAKPARATFPGFLAQPELVKCCSKSHLRAGPRCPSSYSEVFWQSNPTEVCHTCKPRPTVLTKVPQADASARPWQPQQDLQPEQDLQPQQDQDLLQLPEAPEAPTPAAESEPSPSL